MTSRSADFISDISWRYLRDYLTADDPSLFRRYQDLFLEDHGPDFRGTVVELGAEPQYNHGRFFPNATSFITTNIRGDADLSLDVTDMRAFADESQDAYVCVSVLEHVFDLNKAVSEIRRTLRDGGKLLLTIPFAYPRHDVLDYWRLGSDACEQLFKSFHIDRIAHLGGTLSAVAEVLQRPRGTFNSPRHFVYKGIGLLFAFLAKNFDVRDGFPLGFGLLCRKKSARAAGSVVKTGAESRGGEGAR